MSSSTHKILWHNLTKSWLEDFQDHSNRIKIAGRYSLISHGTEKRVVTSGVPEQIAEQMKVPYMKGDFENQFTYGYSWVGQIQSEDDLNDKWAHLLHPHQSHAFVKRGDLSLLPKGLNPKVAALTSNTETALNAIWDAQVEKGNKILIVGYGLIGRLIAYIGRSVFNLEVFVSEKDPFRQRLVLLDGFKSFDENSFSIVFHTSGTREGLQFSIDILGFEGKVIELSWFRKPIEVDFSGTFHSMRKQIVSSQVSHIATPKRNEMTYAMRKELAFQALQQFDAEKLIDHEISFNETPQFYHDLRKNKVSNLATLITY